jgi:hypothetical protein
MGEELTKIDMGEDDWEGEGGGGVWAGVAEEVESARSAGRAVFGACAADVGGGVEAGGC